jgi:hypothetical protein
MPSSGSEHDCPTVPICVIAQQCSSATFTPFQFHSRNSKLCSPPKNIITSNFTCLNKFFGAKLRELNPVNWEECVQLLVQFAILLTPSQLFVMPSGTAKS